MTHRSGDEELLDLDTLVAAVQGEHGGELRTALSFMMHAVEFMECVAAFLVEDGRGRTRADLLAWLEDSDPTLILPPEDVTN